MPKFADIDLHDVEDTLHDAVVYTAMRVRALRGAGWPAIKAEAQQLCTEVTNKYLPDFGCITGRFEYDTGFDDADACVTFGLMGNQTALGRDYSYGSTFAMSLVVNGAVPAVYVADINNGDVLGYGPVTSQVRHWRNFGYRQDECRDEGEALDVDWSLSLDEYSVLLRRERETHSDTLASMVCSVAQGGLFKRYNCLEGVDTVWNMLSLVRGHVGALVLPANCRWTPGYDAPMMGLAKACGMVYLQVDARCGKLHELELRPPLESKNRRSEVVILPRIHAEAFKTAYAARQGA